MKCSNIKLKSNKGNKWGIPNNYILTKPLRNFLTLRFVWQNAIIWRSMYTKKTHKRVIFRILNLCWLFLIILVYKQTYDPSMTSYHYPLHTVTNSSNLFLRFWPTDSWGDGTWLPSGLRGLFPLHDCTHGGRRVHWRTLQRFSLAHGREQGSHHLRELEDQLLLARFGRERWRARGHANGGWFGRRWCS